MGIKSIFNDMASRDNYDEVMEYLAVAETQHAPRFEFDDAPEQLRELIAVAETPRGPERSVYLLLKHRSTFSSTLKLLCAVLTDALDMYCMIRFCTGNTRPSSR